MSRRSTFLACFLGLATISGAAPAGAHEAETNAPQGGVVHVGAAAGLAFPRPLSIEALVGIGRRVVLGAEYSELPPVTLSGVRTTLWAVAGDARVFPLRGPFFVGLRAGAQHLGGSESASFAGGAPLTASLDATTWFVNPRVGVLWTFDSGVTLGHNAGVQIPIASSESTTTPTLSGAPPGAVDSGIARVMSATDPIVRRPLPTFDLLQLGYSY